MRQTATSDPNQQDLGESARGHMNIEPIRTVAVIGHVTGNLGLGVLARDVISALQSRGVSVAALDIDPGIGRVRHDLAHDNLCVERWSDLPGGVAIWVLSPEYLGRTALRFPNLYLRRDALNVALS